MHDARVFRQSEIGARLQNNLLGEQFHLVGDSAYPLSINLLTPYKDNGHLTVQQVAFNVKLSCIRSTIERAFGMLKGKFRRLKYLDIETVELANKIIAATTVLHNIIILNGEDQIEDFEIVENDFQNNMEEEVDVNIRRAGQAKRDIIARI